MELKWIEVVNIGPFAQPAKLMLDSRVTVLTGPNDTGKTSLLRAIQYTFTGEVLQAHHINQERIDSSGVKWHDDQEVLTNYALFVTDQSIKEQMVEGPPKPNDELVMFKRLNLQQSPGSRYIRRGDQRLAQGFNVTKPPQVVSLPTKHEVRDVLPVGSLNEVEMRLLKLGFGQSFNPQAHLALPRAQRVGRVSRAQEILNTRLNEILPPTLRLGFRLTEANDSGTDLSLLLTDPVNCFVAAGCRGAGVQKVLSLMGTLLALTDPARHTLILFDEPENSLHADSQHALRRLLERLAESPLVQVVYATHSPSMINTMRPSSIRVLERIEADGKPMSVINNEAFASNFVRVRSSLGLTPADSLLYAPVTVVVEGPSEVRCLPIAYERLLKEPIKGFEDAEDILSLVHFLDGTGDQYEYMVRLAKSQNAKPILFLDGDKRGTVTKTQEQHPEVPILFLAEGEEFENLVPLEVYIGAIAKVYPEHPGITHEAYQTWLKDKKYKPTAMLSKRVQRWLEDGFDIEPKKPLIMEQAIKDVLISALNTGPLKQLLDKMRELLKEQHPI